MQDGNIHCHVDNLSRRNGKHGERIAVATAAYNAGQRLWSERERRYVDFGNRADVIFSRILLPDSAPDWAATRADLWNKVDLSAPRKDARLAKSIEAAITHDIPAERRSSLLEEFVMPYVALGCAADIAIHEDGTNHNPHVHILLTTRRFAGEAFGSKITALDQRAFVKQVRQRWAELTNIYLEKAGSAHRVDHRSYKARGIGAEPTQHRGPNATERRMKREHARRIREEHIMSPKSNDDRHSNTSPMETLGPEPDLRDAELEQELAENRPTEQDWKTIEASRRDQSPHPVKTAWWDRALANAREKQNQTKERQQVTLPIPDPEQDAERADYERALANEALREPIREGERHLLGTLTIRQEDIREQLETLMYSRRITALRERDEQHLIEQLAPRLEPHQRQALNNYLAERQNAEADRDYPVPGPHGELLSQKDRDAAQDRMLDAYHREEAERERNRER